MSSSYSKRMVQNTAKPLPRPARAFATYIANDKDFPGIGKALARRLEDRFGEFLREVVENQDPRVSEVVGEEIADAAFAAYKFKAHEIDVLDWLQRHGIDEEVGVSTAIKIARVWSVEAVPALSENPYLLLAFLPWQIVDRIAHRFGVDVNDAKRKAAAVEATLYTKLDANDTLVPVDDVISGIKSLLQFDKLSSDDADQIIEAAVKNGAAVRLGGGIQPYGAAVMENEIAQWIADAVTKCAYADLALPLDSSITLKCRIAEYEKQSPYPLTDRQRDAISLGLTSRLMILAGYAGSGKTTSLRGICEVAEAQGRGLNLMALSGRAAQRMSQSTGLPARTIAGFLQAVRNGTERPAPGNIVIIDEASMVDLATLWRVLRAIGDASLILVGDPAQLPPIGFGLTFHTLCETVDVPKVVLDRVLRQTAKSGIPSVAEAVRFGNAVDLPPFRGRLDGVSFNECEDKDVFEFLRTVFRSLVDSGISREEIQVLAPVKAGPAGIEALNHSFHSAKAMVTGATLFPGRIDIAEDDPIIWTKNDWKRGLMNGSLGRFHSVYDGLAHVTIDGQPHDLTIADAELISPAYVISVHKSQGSQWPVVILPIFQSRLLDRTLLYTALTRGAKQVILIGSRDALVTAVKDVPAALRRKVGLRRRLEYQLGSGACQTI